MDKGFEASAATGGVADLATGGMEIFGFLEKNPQAIEAQQVLNQLIALTPLQVSSTLISEPGTMDIEDSSRSPRQRENALKFLARSIEAYQIKLGNTDLGTPLTLESVADIVKLLTASVPFRVRRSTP